MRVFAKAPGDDPDQLNLLTPLLLLPDLHVVKGEIKGVFAVLQHWTDHRYRS